MTDFTETTPPTNLKKNEAKKRTKECVKELLAYQRKMYAANKNSLLVIFQGMDASGKDGVVRTVFGAINPNGCSVKSFKKPTDEEYAHDFLWRVHAETPASGMIKIFNRSHYEDILVPSVYGFIPKEQVEKRYEIINDFEKLVESSGTRILKFFLNVSKDEQETRLKERIENPEKHWKHNDGDWETRTHWDAFQGVYAQLFTRCNTVPWHNIPADKNWYKEYLVAEKVLETLKEINPTWPALDSDNF